jgi:hypothetical protein
MRGCGADTHERESDVSIQIRRHLVACSFGGSTLARSPRLENDDAKPFRDLAESAS